MSESNFASDSDLEPNQVNSGQSLRLFWFITCYGILKAFVPVIVNFLIAFINCDTEKEANLRKQIAELKKEQNGISMVDEFAKHAKIQRKINKMTDDLKSLTDARNILKLKLKYGSLLASYLVMGLITSYLMWQYAKTPLFMVSRHIFYPIGSLLAFPTGVEGGIGITAWIGITFFVGKRLAKCVSV